MEENKTKNTSSIYIKSIKNKFKVIAWKMFWKFIFSLLKVRMTFSFFIFVKSFLYLVILNEENKCWVDWPGLEPFLEGLQPFVVISLESMKRHWTFCFKTQVSRLCIVQTKHNWEAFQPIFICSYNFYNFVEKQVDFCMKRNPFLSGMKSSWPRSWQIMLENEKRLLKRYLSYLQK